MATSRSAAVPPPTVTAQSTRRDAPPSTTRSQAGDPSNEILTRWLPAEGALIRAISAKGGRRLFSCGKPAVVTRTTPSVAVTGACATFALIGWNSTKT